LWAGGMVIFSNALHRLGLMGMPRRTMIGVAAYIQPEWKPLLPLVGIGGAVLTVGALLYFVNIVLTLVASRTEDPYRVACAAARSGPDHAPAIFDRWKPWLVLAGVLIVLAYGPSLARLIAETPFDTAGMRVW